ncbi:tRNA (adenosine(37)-N6)-threonylcarbamoyltransferase complex ATPase subunit type 1 TsaE [Rhodohalobacter sulfatireducens]|jgi:tRNA threonylcarbamoyladenosine biosynthesis protein TsaE|uniref:tRNA threonylcarbamoyladenosine biosynthesis protein TsaE n=1 Tax=Rhodohalobacter sulfatireducens TaxID=2911366 RepID=A0ABS9KC50_9BACT|nr:tRNA (adenosine(37)-N6)-threonylcarbamoyltransferase complex ATPase subunit type 1 TsaE [Rhodohalobacter sulfatireducens]MCG2588408.1 tRNA (adenosine(37)-N6)-threonylcarbamoyltransferase complex ATPase subunit type 1 TsaE [Rhodohalobacter sulfatireducens]MDR9364228.1 tRNA (adenosine(37)-N6)-threonylcarbamoyltransferase complex ATPase subunit type 1 TsaE [Balneolaceae bacterium]MDR9407580.1 tRNA (adenosine(37)-N6)-threonylcarbamoyltransferase complex ATPase subunit type 1 TsaE [Balneolaceae ba
MKTVQSSSPDETIKIAKEFAKTVKPGDVICLDGNLGAGKTQFVKGFVQGLGLSSDIVSSPTFTIINEYEGELPVYHFDCYRLEHVQEALEIGAEEYLYGDGVCVIEWPDRITDLLPPSAKHVTFSITGKKKREISFQ